MADVLHNTLTAADLHEPKGVASATQGQVYVADGSGSGIWTSLSFTTPPGMVAPFLTPIAPFGWLELDGSVLNTATYPALYDVMTITRSGTRVSGQAVITALSSTNNLRIGYYAYGVGIDSGTKILTIDSSSQITLDTNASSTGTADIVFSPWLLNLNTITLPNLTDSARFLRSRSSSMNIGKYQTESIKSHTHSGSTNTIPSHSHFVSGSTGSNSTNHMHPYSYPEFFSSTTPGGPYGISVYAGTSESRNTGIESLNHTHTISLNSSFEGGHNHVFTTNAVGGTETRPNSLVVMYCVKT